MKSIWKVVGFILLTTFVAFGGGNALMPFIRAQAVKKHKWLTDEEMDELIITTNSIPGPSVVEALSYISIKVLGKTKGVIIALLAILPHILFALGLYIIAVKYLPEKYLFVVNVSVMPVIIGILVGFFIRYVKLSRKEIALPLMLGLILFTAAFTVFIPTPWNIPAIILVVVIVIVLIFNHIRGKRKVT